MTQDSINLSAPCESDTILEVRTGRIKTLKGLSIQSAIDKGLRDDCVPVSSEGLDTDEHDYTFHGGPEKAIHACE
jgi:MOSC domain-containing protein YiiM